MNKMKAEVILPTNQQTAGYLAMHCNIFIIRYQKIFMRIPIFIFALVKKIKSYNVFIFNTPLKFLLFLIYSSSNKDCLLVTISS